MRRRIVACLLAAVVAASGIGQTNAVVFAGNAQTPGVQSADEAIPLADGLAAPANVRSTAQEKHSITIAWDAVDGATQYNIYRAKDDPANYKVWLNWEKKVSSTDPFVKVGEVTDGTTAYKDEDPTITTSAPYYYAVTAVNANGEGARSSTCKVEGNTILNLKGTETYSDRALVGMDLAGKDGAETLVTATDANGKEYTKGVYLSWRSFNADFDSNGKLTTTFTVYKNGKELQKDLKVTNLIDPSGSAKDKYRVVGSNDGDIKVKNDTAITPWSNKYLELSLYAPANQTMPADSDGIQATCTYSANDLSVGDVDGDGQLELIVKWYPSNAQDNSIGGYTGETFLDTYDVDYATGKVKLLTRINMGINIRSGAHYTQFQVWDFDGDGKAEVAVKTCHGTTTYKSEDGTDKTLKQVDHVGERDNTQLPPQESKTVAEYDYRNNGGHIIVGDEFFSIFNLDDGTKAAPDVKYEPERGSTGDEMKQNWGNPNNSSACDDYGNRSERYLSGTAYLDGETPFAVFTRGYYARIAMTAYYLKDTNNDGIGDTIDTYWKYDTGPYSNEDKYQLYEAAGNHGLSINDVDGDGKDEIIFGSLVIDHDGTVRNNTGLEHGDAMHVSDWVSWNDGLEVMDVHEHDGVSLHVEVHDANTGEVLMGYFTGKDTGRGVMADIDPTAEGGEWWSIASPTTELNDEPEWDSNDGEVYSSHSIYKRVYNEETKQWETTSELEKLADQNPPANFTLFWDGDLLSELQDHSFDKKSYSPRSVKILKWDYENGKTVPLLDSSEIWTNNGTKGNVGLAADILGDWRTEIITRTSDAAGKPNNTVRIYSTTIQTDYVVPCLLENLAYRQGVAWQNVGYNQPANLSYLLSEDLVTAQLVTGEKTVNTADILFTEANDGRYGHEITGYEIYRAENGTGNYQKIDTVSVSDLTEYKGEIPTEVEEKGKEFLGYQEGEIVGKYDFGEAKGNAEGFVAINYNTVYDAAVGYGLTHEVAPNPSIEEEPNGHGWKRLGFTLTGTDGYDANLVTAASDIALGSNEIPFQVDLDAGTYRVTVYAGGAEDNGTYRTNKILVNDEDLGTTTCEPKGNGVYDISTYKKETVVTLDSRGQIAITASNPNSRALMNAVVIRELIPIYSEVEDTGTTDMPSTDTDNRKWYVYKDSDLRENASYQYKIAAVVDGKTSFLSRATDVRTSVAIKEIPKWNAIELVQNTPLKGSTIKELLPTEMSVTGVNGGIVTTPVKWSGYAAVDISKVGEYTIQADVQGYTGGLVPVTVNVIPNKVTGLAKEINARVVINTSVAPELPATVDLQYLNGMIRTVGVVWNAEDIAAIDVTKYTDSPQPVRGICPKADYNNTDFDDFTAFVTVEDDYIIAIENLYPEVDLYTSANDIESMLPQNAVVTYKKNGEKTLPVIWSDIVVDTNTLGYYTGTAKYHLSAEYGYDEVKEASVSVTYPLVMRFDFGIEGSPAVDGWTGVNVNGEKTTKTLQELGADYTKERGYGFVDEGNIISGRQHGYEMEGVLPENVYTDFVVGNGNTFAVDLPNGTYEVTIVAGSNQSGNNVVGGRFQDGTKLSVTSKQGQYVMQAAIVNVTEGQLTFKWTDGVGRTPAMIIRSVSEKPTPKPGDKIVLPPLGEKTAVYTYKKDGSVELKSMTSTNTKVTVPNTITDTYGNTYKVTSIAASAFKSNKKVTQVTIGDNVTAIAANQFSGMTKLTKVTIGKGVKTIGKNAFKGDKKLATVTFKSTSKVATIKASAFEGCVKLKSITLPDSVKTIDTAAFSGCSILATVKIGTSAKSALTTIGKNAFKNDKKLKTVTIKSTKLKTVKKNAFSGVKKSTKIKVPQKKLSAYKKLFKNAKCKATVTK